MKVTATWGALLHRQNEQLEKELKIQHIKFWALLCGEAQKYGRAELVVWTDEWARKLEKNERTVRRWLRVLEEVGLIDRHVRGRGYVLQGRSDFMKRTHGPVYTVELDPARATARRSELRRALTEEVRAHSKEGVDTFLDSFADHPPDKSTDKCPDTCPPTIFKPDLSSHTLDPSGVEPAATRGRRMGRDEPGPGHSGAAPEPPRVEASPLIETELTQAKVAATRTVEEEPRGGEGVPEGSRQTAPVRTLDGHEAEPAGDHADVVAALAVAEYSAVVLAGARAPERARELALARVRERSDRPAGAVLDDLRDAVRGLAGNPRHGEPHQRTERAAWGSWRQVDGLAGWHRRRVAPAPSFTAVSRADLNADPVTPPPRSEKRIKSHPERISLDLIAAGMAVVMGKAPA